MSSTLDAPSSDRLWADESGPPSPPPPRSPRGTGGDPTPPKPPRRRRAPVAVLLTISALLGGGVSAAVLAETGALSRTVNRTVVAGTTVSDTSSSTSGSTLNAKAIYAATTKGVVSITATGVSSESDQSASPFGGTQPEQAESTATGTGFAYDDEGHILTAEHVVDGASSVSVELQDGTTRKATVLGTDDATDVAVLKIDASGTDLEPLALGSSAGLTVGDEVAAIGDPFGYQRSISTGIASGLDRTIEAPNGFEVAHAVQTDAALNPGNSGGPLVDAQGKVVGIVDQIATGSSGADQNSGVGFAVPIDVVSKEVATLEAGDTVRHAYIGVATGDDTSADGALVGTVTQGGPAAAAGLKQGDVITKVDGKAIDGSSGLVAAIATHQPGDRVTVTVRRDSNTVSRTVTLGTQPAQSNG